MALKLIGLTVFSIVIAVVLFKVLQELKYLPNPQLLNVEIRLGKLVGITGLSREGRVYNSFTRVPYAKPPTGALRFKSPVAVDPWYGMLDARKPSPDCLQIEPTLKSRNGQEDCLYLNIYSPRVNNITNEKSKLLPVIAYIHGGHYMFGGSAILGPQYFMDENVVLVTFNYRLGALGFLNTGDGTVTGNMGLRDQVKALEWIKENIHYFGGDKNSVTLMGSSAGGSSVQLLMLSDMSRGLFHKAISHSGSSLSAWGFTKVPEQQAKRLGIRMGCPYDDSKELLECLMKKSAEEIVDLQRETLDIFHAPEAIYSPSVESSGQTSEPIFLKDSPHALLKAGKFHTIPWITGVVSEEGCYRSPQLLNSPEKLQKLNRNWNHVAKNLFLLNADSSDGISQKIRDFYFGEANPVIGMKVLQGITNALSDRFFISGVRDAAVLHSKEAPTFLYYFSYKGDFTLAPILKASAKTGLLPIFTELITEIIKNKVYRLFGWENILSKYLGLEAVDYGVCHVDCQFQFFQFHPLLRTPQGSKHYEFSRSMVRLWVEFAQSSLDDGQRTPELYFNGVEWTPLKFNHKLKYFNFGNGGSAMIDEPFTERLEFWKSLNLQQN